MTMSQKGRQCAGGGRAAALVAMLAGEARAESNQALLDQGVLWFEQGEFERSLDTLKRVRAEVLPSRSAGRLQLYLGLDHAFLGRIAKARAAFVAALTHDPELELDPHQIKPSVVELFREVKQGLTGDLEVHVSGSGTFSVAIDGSAVGPAPLSRTVLIGRHQVIVRSSDGAIVLDRAVVVGARQAALLRVSARARPSPSVPADAVPVARPQQPAALGDSALGPRSPSRLWTWVAASATLVTAGLAVGVWRWGASEYDEYLVAQDEGRIRELESSVRSKYIGADVLVGVSSALAVSTVGLWFLEGRSGLGERQPDRAALPAGAIRIGPAAGPFSGISAFGSF